MKIVTLFSSKNGGQITICTPNLYPFAPTQKIGGSMEFVVECVEVVYFPGSYYQYTGVKDGTHESRTPDGILLRPRGHGVGEAIQNTKLILIVKFENDSEEVEFEEVEIGRFFKDSVGKLTENRRKAIIRSMPNTVIVSEEIRRDGEKYYKVIPEDLENWLSRSGLSIEKL